MNKLRGKIKSTDEDNCCPHFSTYSTHPRHFFHAQKKNKNEILNSSLPSSYWNTTDAAVYAGGS